MNAGGGGSSREIAASISGCCAAGMGVSVLLLGVGVVAGPSGGVSSGRLSSSDRMEGDRGGVGALSGSESAGWGGG